MDNYRDAIDCAEFGSWKEAFEAVFGSPDGFVTLPRSGKRIEIPFVLEPDGPRPRHPGERMHALHEVIFGRLGPALRTNGWSCFPQQKSERRKPAVVDKVTLKWGPYQERLPNEREMRSWSLQCPGENVAVITGPASGGSPTEDGLECALFALDLDINDRDLSYAVRMVANRVLGETRFLRWGRAPRVIMLYRHHASMRLAKRAFRFGQWVDGKWGASEHALEILANGSPFTAYGTHHKTGGYFKWSDAQPFLNPPSDAPLVTKAQLDEFLSAVEEVRRFFSKRTVVDGDTKSSNFDAAAAAFDPGPHGLMPDMSCGGDWVIENGVVTDGAHAYLLKYTRLLVCANGHAFGNDAVSDIMQERRDADRAALESAAREHVKTVLALDYKASRQKVVAKFESTLKDTITGFREGRKGLKAIFTSAGADGRHREAARLTTAFARDGSLHWLGERANTSGLTITTSAERRSYVRGFVSAYSEEAARERALGQDRSAAIAKVVATNVAAARAFLADVEARKAGVVLNTTPMGAGKTTTTIGELVAMMLDEQARGLPYQGAFVFLQRDHQLIGESLIVAMRSGVRFDVVIPAGADAAIAEVEAAGLRGVHLKSKLLAGCERSEALKLLHAAGLRSSGLCKSDLVDADGNVVYNEDGKTEKVKCPFFGACGYHRMLERLKTAHIVFAPHYWLTKDVNESIVEPRGLVIDESVVHSMVEVAFVPQAALTSPRPAVELSFEEFKELRNRYRGDSSAFNRAHRMRSESVMADRARAAALVLGAHMRGTDLVREVAAQEGGLDWVKAGLRVCTNAYRLAREVFVGSSDAQVAEVCSAAKPEHLEGERRFWKVLAEAVEVFLAAEKARIEAGLPEEPVTADSFPVDLRLQALTDGPPEAPVRSWRVSWRNGTNWLNTPTLLLDATADVEVTRLLYHGREVVVHKAALDLNLRVVMVADRSYSPSSMYPVPDPSDPDDKRKQDTAKALRARVMDLASMVVGAHGNGRTVLATTKGIEERFHAEWGRPKVCDPVHYGALRGLDFAKGHSAACGVGRTEQTIPVLDGLVAGMIWDKKDKWEHPYNRRGDMRTADGKPLFRTRELRTVRIRSGHDVRLEVPCMPTDLARRVESLWREAEVQQFLGRLRGVHRPDAAFVLLMCDCPPEGLLVDDLLTLDEALGPDAVAWRTFSGLVMPGVSEVRTGMTPEQVISFVARYRGWPAMRTIPCTAPDGTEVVGLAAAWVEDVHGALRKAGAPAWMLATAQVSKLRVAMVPSVARTPDAMMQAEAARAADFEVWQVLHPQREGEDEGAYRLRYLATYDPAEFEEEDEQGEPEPSPESVVADMLRRAAAHEFEAEEEELEPC